MQTPERDFSFARPARFVRVEQVIAIPPVDTRTTIEYTLRRDGSLENEGSFSPLELAGITVDDDFADLVTVDVTADRISAEMLGMPLADERIVRDERGRIRSVEDMLARTTQRHHYTDNEFGDWIADVIEIVQDGDVIGRSTIMRTIEYW